MKRIESTPKGRSDTDLTSGIYPYLHELNITDGGEFLDDAIRTKDQPLSETIVKEDK